MRSKKKLRLSRKKSTMADKFIIGGAPHVHGKESVKTIMWQVSLALMPAGIAGIILFGLPALQTITLAVAAALGTEALIQKLTRSSLTLGDGSAFLTGLLLAFNLPAAVPWWIPVTGSAFAIAIGKMVFGGLGQNIFNPALVGRAFLMASWPAYMTSFVRPFDAITGATPLAALKHGKALEYLSYMDMFLGKRGGCIGEVCIAALLIGAIFLLIRGHISWHIPASFIASTGLIVWVFGPQGFFTGDWLLHILSGGLILGAFFMATDYVTSPLTRKGQLIFGIGCGALAAVIRLWGGYPEGVCYAILMMNAATPLIDRFTRNRIYGTQ
jgi:Na+-translocating ferredoxin:NAD+ oxidoreductase subunit D